MPATLTCHVFTMMHSHLKCYQLAYQGAIQYPLGLDDTNALENRHMCASCYKGLVDGPLAKQYRASR